MNPTVFIVDDDPSVRKSLTRVMTSAGYAVETVVPKSEINILIPLLRDAGATDIIELPLAKIVH